MTATSNIAGAYERKNIGFIANSLTNITINIYLKLILQNIPIAPKYTFYSKKYGKCYQWLLQRDSKLKNS